MIDWTSLVPNLIAYWDQFIKSLSATVQMFLLAGIFIFLFGFFFAILLIVTQDGGIRPNRTVHRIVEIFINVFRSIPFVILMIFL
ncbi:MAG: ABC transporter permease, partial [Lachnospiraceae bacterium]|nr:ABC transporter permease [Galactobacillus timonensis]MDY5223497.1 ABC transporter permease [Lachnospiraceae bacterium]